MSWQAWFTLVVVALTVYALARALFAPAVTVFGALVTLLLASVITPAQALAGFANAAPVTVAALFILARAVEKTGALQPLIDRTLGSRRRGRGALFGLLAPVMGASAFLNNTPIVAMLAPQVADWAERRGRSASAYLMPISFATILGGVITVIGTSTNLLVSGMMEARGMAPIGMFELTWLGLPVALAGLAVLIVLTPIVLPERRPARQQFEDDIREFVTHATVVPGGPLDGRTVEAAGLRNLQGVFLVQIERAGEVIAPVAPLAILRGGDRLSFAGRVDMVRDLQSTRGLRSAEHEHTLALNGDGHTFYEAVVSATSPLVGKTIKEVGFRGRYDAAVLAIHRAGARVNEKLGSVRLKEGDTLLLLAERGFLRRWRDHSDFLLVARRGGSRPPSSRQALLVAIIALGVVGVAGLGLLPILQASLVGALALVATGVLSPAEARAAVEMDVLVLIAASFGIGAAIEQSGLAAALGHLIVEGFSRWGPLGVLLAVTLATIALTELITNNAAAALVFPIAIAVAGQLGLDPRPYAIAVAVAASASFLTPIGYQTNTMVYGPGGYRFGDFARLGAPITAVVVAVIMVVVPLVWPLARP
ncbi:MAG: SLC13 family permease [Gemmatimonadetes bacterium]|nr:SLC13 family permease [Gemmatimonadota bacterium]